MQILRKTISFAATFGETRLKVNGYHRFEWVDIVRFLHIHPIYIQTYVYKAPTKKQVPPLPINIRTAYNHLNQWQATANKQNSTLYIDIEHDGNLLVVQSCHFSQPFEEIDT